MQLIDSYLETEVLTASPHRLHLIVVDGAVRHARQAREAIERGNREEIYLALNRSREFVAELIGGIRVDAMPEMAERFKSLLAFVYRNLALADLETSVQRVDDAIRILEIHRETWLQVGHQLVESESAIPKPHALDWVT